MRLLAGRSDAARIRPLALTSLLLIRDVLGNLVDADADSRPPAAPARDLGAKTPDNAAEANQAQFPTFPPETPNPAPTPAPAGGSPAPAVTPSPTPAPTPAPVPVGLSTLSATIAKAETSIPLVDTKGFVAGEKIYIDPGTQIEEENTIQTLSRRLAQDGGRRLTAGSMKLKTPTKFAHASGAQIANSGAVAASKRCTAPTVVNAATSGSCAEGASIAASDNCTTACASGFAASETELVCSQGALGQTGTLSPTTFNCTSTLATCTASTVVNEGTTGPCKEGSSIVQSSGKCTASCLVGFTPSVAQLTCSDGTLTPAFFSCQANILSKACTAAACLDNLGRADPNCCQPLGLGTCTTGYQMRQYRTTANKCTYTSGLSTVTSYKTCCRYHHERDQMKTHSHTLSGKNAKGMAVGLAVASGVAVAGGALAAAGAIFGGGKAPLCYLTKDAPLNAREVFCSSEHTLKVGDMVTVNKVQTNTVTGLKNSAIYLQTGLTQAVPKGSPVVFAMGRPAISARVHSFEATEAPFESSSLGIQGDNSMGLNTSVVTGFMIIGVVLAVCCCLGSAVYVLNNASKVAMSEDGGLFTEDGHPLMDYPDDRSDYSY